MKKIKRILSLVLCLVMLMSVSIIRGGNIVLAAAECNCANTPIIYVKGRTNIYKTTDDISEGNLAELNFSGGDGAIADAALNISAAFIEGLATDEWDNYCDVLYDEISPLYDQYALGNDGEIHNQSGIDPYWSIEKLCERVRKNGINGHTWGRTDVTHFQFQYDMRLDPCKNAADLNTYIETIKEVSGHDKVHIIARCEGAVIANAYFNIFGYDSVESYISYNGIAAGAEIADDLFSNKALFDPDAINSFVNQFIDSSVILDFVKASVNLAAFNGLLEEGTDFVDSIYDKVSSNIMPRMIRAIFGTSPGWWGMVSPDVIDECQAFVFNDNEDGKYNELIAKIDNYNDNYKVNARGILEEMEAAGVKMYVIAKYGSPMYPVIESVDILGDGVVSLYKQTFEGATSEGYRKTLSDSYITSRIDAGFEKYISPDKMVDASTAPFTDHVWYIKGLNHDTYPDEVDEFILQIFRNNGYADVNTFADKPQFMLFNASGKTDSGKQDGVLEPLTPENKDVTEDTSDTSSIFTVIMRWFTTLFNLIASLFRK